MAKHSKYVTNRKGERVSVVLDIADYQKILEDLEELEAIRAYDAAKSSADSAIPFRQAVEEIKRTRK